MKVNLPTSAESLIKEARAFNLKKRLGQHFLIDVDALQRIADLLGAGEHDTAIEVGPGIGFLTRFLIDKGAHVIAVDLDRESIARLEQLGLPNLEIKHGDFLQFNLNTLQFYKRHPTEQATEDPGPEHLKIVGNVPYQITGLIIGHILGEIDRPSPWLHRVDNIVLTVQHEVGKRLVAKAGSPDYSKASLLIEYFCESSLELVLPPDAFYPPPQVTSAIVRMVPRKRPPVKCENTHLLKQVINAGFRQRRKMLRNALSFLRLPQTIIDQVFRELGFDPQVRAERLSLAQFAMLADALNKHLQTHANSRSTVSSES